MKFLSAVVIAALTVAASPHEMVAHIEKHLHKSARLAELKAATLIALKMQSSEEVKKTGRSPMAEVAALTDMMLIQTENEITQLQVAHTQYQGTCKKNKHAWSDVIADKKRVQDNKFKEADGQFSKWNHLLPVLPELDKKIRNADVEVRKEEEKLQAAQAGRNLAHKRYQKAMTDHAKALDDVRAIRLILQNSNLDDRSNKEARVSAGKKTALAEVRSSLLEYKEEAHPITHNLIQLAAEVAAQGSGMDTIYKLIYKTRDALITSRNKLIKEEETAVSSWRTSKIAHQNDINDVRILRHSYYMRSGITRRQIGVHKKYEGSLKIKMAQAVKIKEEHKIMKDFLLVACAEDQRVYSRTFAGKLNEKKALLAVQKKLVSLKWSNKVYSAVEQVSAGITYLKGVYNLKSNLGRYVTHQGTTLSCMGTKHAGQFHIALQSDDLSYLIFTEDSKKKMYVTLDEDKNRVYLRFDPTQYSRWNFKFDKSKQTFQIDNKKAGVNWYVDAADKFEVSTKIQVNDDRSQFKLERTTYSEVGCFKNKINKQLEHYVGAFNNMNTEKCAKACPIEKYPYFGLTEGKQCFCGGTFNRDPAPYSDCSAICPGRGGESCGGSFRTIVFKNEKEKPLVPTTKK